MLLDIVFSVTYLTVGKRAAQPERAFSAMAQHQKQRLFHQKAHFLIEFHHPLTETPYDFGYHSTNPLLSFGAQIQLTSSHC
jgi:hypothetical protein